MPPIPTTSDHRGPAAPSSPRDATPAAPAPPDGSSPRRPGPSRRDALRLVAGAVLPAAVVAPPAPVAAATTSLATALTGRVASGRRTAGGLLDPIRDEDFGDAEARHLLVRMGFGGTPAEVRRLADLGPRGAVRSLLRPAAPPPPGDAGLDPDVMRPYSQDERSALARARRAGDEAALDRARRERQQRQRTDRRQMRTFQSWWLRRLLASPRPFEEKMTLFWHGHFATSYRTVENAWHLDRQNHLFRRHTAGNFKALVHEIIRDPAMLKFLNNDRSNRRRPNENLARELMELFTLGEGNEYTERDIKEGARALTGYTFRDDDFVFNANAHDPGRKRLLGRTGDFDGDDFVDLIFARRSASEFICLKLHRFFVNDAPGEPDRETQRVVQALGSELRRADFELRPVLETLFTSRHFHEARHRASIIKSPVQLLAEAVRTLQLPPRDPDALLDACSLMGQDLGFPPSVKGWPGGRAWVNTSTLFVRQNVMNYLLTGRRPAAYRWRSDPVAWDPSHLVQDLADPPAGAEPPSVVPWILRYVLPVTPAPERLAPLEDFLVRTGHAPGAGRPDRDALVGLMTLVSALPEYQLC